MNQTYEEARTQIEANTVDENLTFLSPPRPPQAPIALHALRYWQEKDAEEPFSEDVEDGSKT